MPQPYRCTRCRRKNIHLNETSLVHNHKPNFSITCGLNNRKSSFTIYESFRRHVYRKYRKLVLPPDDMDATENMDYDDDLENTIELQPRADEMHPPSRNEFLTNFKENLFSFILKCREKNHIPQIVQQKIVNDINFLFYFRENYDTFIIYHLQKNRFIILEWNKRNGTVKRFFFEEASKIVSSPHMLKEHCKSNLRLVELVHEIFEVLKWTQNRHIFICTHHWGFK